ncbi:chloride channel [Protomyces lactucae-debilis]|uniref:Chloride channel protein n=1 Tax=Protomyces lactucae-debilis TaxID=2754530 RepID=A0A1Y2FQI7_PROLT|nr:chloride channel [Protomyces lactucae-debilis]ORY85584.1 chloride channel [Protomyces lactucae-debilis]
MTSQRAVKSVSFSHPASPAGGAQTERTALLSSNGNSAFYTWSSRSAPVSPGTTSPMKRTKQDRQLRISKSFASIAQAAQQQGYCLQHDSILEKNRTFYDNYMAVDWLGNGIADARRLDALRADRSVRGRARYAWDALQGWLLMLAIGILTALIAYAVMMSEVALYSLKSGYCTTPDGFFLRQSACPEGLFHYWSDHAAKQFFIYLSICLGLVFISSSLTMTTLTVFPNGKTIYMAAGSGIPEVKTILSGFVIHGYLGFRVLAVKCIGLTLAVASGLPLGKEGPFVHLACCVANVLTRFVPKFHESDAKRREALSAACAAGVAAAFGAPIGGVLFALEEVSYYFTPKVIWRSFFCSAITAIVLKSLNPHGTGKLTLLETTFSKDWHYRELPIFVLLGCFGGLFGALFCNANLAWSRHFRRHALVARHPIIEVLTVTLLATAVSYWNRFTQMGGVELVDDLLTECVEMVPSPLCPSTTSDFGPIVRALSYALFIKCVLTVITFGCRIPAGIFVPTMAVGALFGRILGISLQQLALSSPNLARLGGLCPIGGAGDCIVPGIYAMIGCAATLAGVTRMTVSLAVIMSELTGSLDFVVPFMLAILVAKWVAESIQPQGIYDLLIELNDHPYLDAKSHHYQLQNAELVDLLPSQDIMLRTAIDVTQSSTVRASQLRQQILWSREAGLDDSGFSIVKAGELVGYIALADLSLALDLLPAQQMQFKPAGHTIDQGLTDEDEFSGDMPILIDPTVTRRPHSRPPADPAAPFSDVLNEASTTRHADLTTLVDRSPLTLQCEAPLELALEMFSKLGLRYLCVLDGSEYRGTIHKRRFLRFLNDLGHRA